MAEHIVEWIICSFLNWESLLGFSRCGKQLATILFFF